MSIGIVGGGIIGLSIAFELVERGRTDITVYDRDPTQGAGLVAAGMLAPTAEAGFGEEVLQDLMSESMRRWPSFAERVEARTGTPIAYRTDGTLLVALTADDQAEVERLIGFYHRAGRPIEPLSGRALRELEPLLAPRVRGGARAPGDHQVDPRRLLRALRMLPVRFEARDVVDLSTLQDDVIIVANGVGAAALTGLPVRPVKGQLLRLRGAEPLLRHVVRGIAAGRDVYLVPRADGELIVGATEEERGADRTVTAGGLLDLLRPAADLLPGVAELVLSETLAGLRPSTPDNAPVIDRLESPRVIVAAGHHRNGVLLAPATAAAVAETVIDGATSIDISAFGAGRFT
ncbi:glycine oxidase ThiO [Dactylosporangium matsuzakiense]|uniref:glycine oxidase n=1 Tax=Dactylosporangium matsuzakiense TaxID=53360 RepID=A0A9W6KRD0_9ACTN|nr:glycine oxidase ThiO [Dactylosporangium matsuzakiense]UWZ43381.1 glycine oxidase ThiO [Dactylosporangium matsuzakiense]GLL05015.1 glycine oxidase ThiO [Dactylosporangium matsuzakiense]